MLHRRWISWKRCAGTRSSSGSLVGYRQGADGQIRLCQAGRHDEREQAIKDRRPIQQPRKQGIRVLAQFESGRLRYQLDWRE